MTTFRNLFILFPYKSSSKINFPECTYIIILELPTSLYTTLNLAFQARLFEYYSSKSYNLLGSTYIIMSGGFI